jgi:hypothetical protein
MCTYGKALKRQRATAQSLPIGTVWVPDDSDYERCGRYLLAWQKEIRLDFM